MPMTGFFCQDEYLAKLVKLTDEEVGRLFRALMDYHKNGVVSDLDGRESIAFDFIKEDIDNAELAYQKKCDQASENRRKGLMNKSTDVNARQRPLTDDNGSDHNNINKIYVKENKKDISDRFDRFWAVYPRHIAKQDARKKFEKLNPDDELLAVMIQAVEKQKKSEQWTKDGGQFIPHPSTWLNQKRWEDEVPVQVKSVRVLPAQAFPQRDYSNVDGDLMGDLEREIAAMKAGEAG